MKKLDFVFFDAGGGHRAAATALKAICDQQKRPWEVRMVNLQEVLDPLDIFRKLTGIRLQDIYNKMLAKGWTLCSAQGLQFIHGVIKVYHRHGVRLLEEYWKRESADMVVSLVPNLDRVMAIALRSASPLIPFVTILTDLADYPPHFWIERESQYIICGTPKAAEQARALGHTEDRIFQTSGMILRPNFYEPVAIDRVVNKGDERRRLGLDPQRPTGLVLFGGQGSKVMIEIAKRLPETQLILICGHNQGLARTLRSLPAAAPRFVEGFTQDIPYYMGLADFFIGKPGPGSISEAVHMDLPVIVERNAWTLPQERYNTEWIEQQGVGVVLKNFREIAPAVARMEANLDQYREAASRIHNRALFEIPEILERLLNRSQPEARSQEESGLTDS